MGDIVAVHAPRGGPARAGAVAVIAGEVVVIPDVGDGLGAEERALLGMPEHRVIITAIVVRDGRSSVTVVQVAQMEEARDGVSLLRVAVVVVVRGSRA